MIELIFVIVILAIIMSVAIATYPQLVSNMQIRIDRTSAINITKALRGWYEDSMSDPQKKESIKTFVEENLYLKTMKLEELENMGIDLFIDPNYSSNSLKDSNGNIDSQQGFYVGVIGQGQYMKFVITVESEAEGGRLSGIDTTSVANYDGTTSAVIYIES